MKNMLKKTIAIGQGMRGKAIQIKLTLSIKGGIIQNNIKMNI